ncbi:MAG TPA: O-antigen ligase family protein [Baekduia sp.]|uniref:O-antigen ligase family protein n=1 Tax=Baekduia sp. TaxID=2600305 RepID=UPI002D78EE4D|nr:O-antigen ligase family protein [Baekduia sp.]HET6508412.1 O-antigen ligase family protein [Baekduia sp.]
MAGAVTFDRVRGGHVLAIAVGLLTGLLVGASPLLVLGVIFAAGGLWVLITRPEWTLLGMIAALPWENELQFPSATLSAVKAVGAIVLLAYMLKLAGQRRTIVHLPALLGIATAFTLWVGASVITSTGITDSVTKLIRYLLFFVFFFLVVQLVDGRVEVRRVLRVYVGSVALAAFYGILLFLGGKTTGRVAGPVEDPNDFGYLLATTLPLCAYLLTFKGGRKLPWAAAFVLIAAAMLATLSRGALVGCAALLAWGLVTRRVPIRVLLGGVLALVAVAALALTLWRPLLDSALHQKAHIANANQVSRQSFWRGALLLTIDHPVLGVGPQRFPPEVLPLLRNNPENIGPPVTHNSYLEILAEDGAPALALFLAYLAGAWLILRSVQRRAAEADDTDEQRLATALQAALIIAIVSASFLSEQLTTPFWLLGALACVVARDAYQHETSAERAARRRAPRASAAPPPPRPAPVRSLPLPS